MLRMLFALEGLRIPAGMLVAMLMELLNWKFQIENFNWIFFQFEIPDLLQLRSLSINLPISSPIDTGS